jgi:hypothetical protein
LFSDLIVTVASYDKIQAGFIYLIKVSVLALFPPVSGKIKWVCLVLSLVTFVHLLDFLIFVFDLICKERKGLLTSKWAAFLLGDLSQETGD